MTWRNYAPGLVAKIIRADHGLSDDDHGTDPPVGARLAVLELEIVDGEVDTVIVDWMNLRWPMLIEDVELGPSMASFTHNRRQDPA